MQVSDPNACMQGGDLQSGIVAYDGLQSILRSEETLELITLVEGSVCSAGTLISLAGSRRLMTKHATLLIHQIWNTGTGDAETYEDVKAEFENMTLFMELLRKIYRARCSIPEEEFGKMMSKDMYLAAEECLQYGIVDEII